MRVYVYVCVQDKVYIYIYIYTHAHIFQTIQFIIVICLHSQVLPLRARMDPGAMTMKKNSALHKVPALPEPHHQIV